jgi:hypothetical protein
MTGHYRAPVKGHPEAVLHADLLGWHPHSREPLEPESTSEVSVRLRRSKAVASCLGGP